MSDLVRQPQYYLIACGTKDYPNLGDYESLDSVEADIERVVNVLSKFGYQRVLTSNLDLNPSRDALIVAFAEWLQSEELDEADRVVFYYSGHGHSIEGDRHYLLLRDTRESVLAQTSVATDELVRPLINKGVNTSQILYIIDTCYAGQGVAEISNFASNVIDKHQGVYASNRKSVHLIAASRLKQPAKAGVFSELFQSELERCLDCSDETTELRFIQPSSLTEKINDAIDETQRSKQRVGHSQNLCEKEVCFFPIYPKKLIDWEVYRDNAIQQLLEFTGNRREEVLLFMNSFLLMSSPKLDLVFEETDILSKLKYLGSLPVVNGVCPLLALSEWVKQQFLLRKYRKNLDREIIGKISVWQQELQLYRDGVDFHKVEAEIKSKLDEFREILAKKQPRLQVEVEPEVDTANNTGQKTGAFNLYVNLYVRDSYIPLARLIQKKLSPLANGNEEKSAIDCFMDCLEEKRTLSKIVDRIHLILSPEKSKSLILELEFILPFDYFEIPVDQIACSYTPKFKKVLGTEYPLFINSYERYFDEDYFRSKEDVYLKKERLWQSDDHELVVCYDDDICAEGAELHPDDFEEYDIFVGSRPSLATLDIIEAAFPIAVWSRDDRTNLRAELEDTQWQDWPQQIRALRKRNKSANITLFWDDLYPKPSERSRPLNTSVVE
jgi:hypothetical protein